MDEDGMLKRTHSKSLEKLDTRIKFKVKVTRSFFAFCLHVQTSYGKSLILHQFLPFMFENAICRIVNHHLVLSWFYPR